MYFLRIRSGVYKQQQYCCYGYKGSEKILDELYKVSRYARDRWSDVDQFKSDFHNATSGQFKQQAIVLFNKKNKEAFVDILLRFLNLKSDRL